MIEASAPSNIALIKYMGKIDSSSNVPTNSSLSYTLENFRTTVTIEKAASQTDDWQPLVGSEFHKIELSNKGKEKFLSHFVLMKKVLGLDGFYKISSANNFPSDAGLASSASSFAALTRAAYALKKSLDQSFEISDEKLSTLSRQGSGSSCRSFFSPWAIWDEESVREIKLPIQKLNHHVFIFESGVKKVSSSEAHSRVVQSPLFIKDSNGRSRIERAEKRMSELLGAFQEHHWTRSYEICWDEFWDMHELFHTSTPAFTYLTEEVKQTLKKMRSRWEKEGCGPIITLDAGANIHTLFRHEDKDLLQSWLAEFEPGVRPGTKVH